MLTIHESRDSPDSFAALFRRSRRTQHLALLMLLGNQNINEVRERRESDLPMCKLSRGLDDNLQALPRGYDTISQKGASIEEGHEGWTRRWD